MIALAWSFFVVLSMVIASSQALLAAPVPGYAHHGLSALQSSTVSGPSSGHLTASRLREAVAVAEEDDQDDPEEEDINSTAEDYVMGAPAPPPPPPAGPAAAPVGRARSDEQTVYVIEFETEADGKGEGHRNHKDMSDDGSDGQSPLDPWSIVWYIGSFGGLVAFFLIVSCSEWCCRRGARPLSVPYTQRGEVINANGQPATESPPPPYHLFAPPPYDSVNYAEIADKSATGEKLDIYVITVPIHPSTNQQLQNNQLQQQQQNNNNQQQQEALVPRQQLPPA